MKFVKCDIYNFVLVLIDSRSLNEMVNQVDFTERKYIYSIL